MTQIRKTLANGARQLPLHHITIRVPWHDSGWTGTVCAKPEANTSCLVLPRIGTGKQDKFEKDCAGCRLDQLDADSMPPCIGEHVTFMAPFEMTRTMRHPYVKSSPDTHGHFAPTSFIHNAYSAACVPFRWMLRDTVEGSDLQPVGMASELSLGWQPDREPELSFNSAWIQDRSNQLTMLDTFFGAIRPEESLCFFYAKRTPLSEQTRRVIVGVGRVISVGDATEYQYAEPKPKLRSVLWERNIGHSIRPGFIDGFLFPYSEILELAASGAAIDPEDFVAFAPDEELAAFSYGSELLTHDGAVASLIACSSTLDRMRGVVEGPWDAALAWIDAQINRMWSSRGAFPGLGSALYAFGYEWGFQRGNLLAYEIDLLREQRPSGSAWDILEEVMQDPTRLSKALAESITPNLRKGWKTLDSDKRALLQLLSRCSVTGEQALRFYDAQKRKDSRIEVSEYQVLSNPYELFERDRHSLDAVAFATVDRGMFPDASIQTTFPIPALSRVDDPSDCRRVRALVLDILNDAAKEGHTLLPQDWLIQKARLRAMNPPCPLGENVLAAHAEFFGSVVERTVTDSEGIIYQSDQLTECRRIIRQEVRLRAMGKPTIADLDWRALVDSVLGPMNESGDDDRQLELEARSEKAAALQQLYQSRIAVLLGPAGTGKTTLLRTLCSLPDVKPKGILLLAPTGKARVRLEEQTQMRGRGQTLAQFLSKSGRYDGNTGRYSTSKGRSQCGDYRTVIVDECSMLTEPQLASLFDACANVERYILVGDPRQLPPIGAGRPFVDIVNKLAPENIDSLMPKCAPCYAELTIPRRQSAAAGNDILLASLFSGRAPDPGADEIWGRLEDDTDSRLRLVAWQEPRQLEEIILQEISQGLGLQGIDDELGFELSLGGTRFGDFDRAFFSNQYQDRPGAASQVEAWQILSPVRAGVEGVDALNRHIQQHFRAKWKAQSLGTHWNRTIPKPFGPQGLIYGDKVINLVNQIRSDVYPEPDQRPYIANGDLGVIVGQYKGKNSKMEGSPYKIEVEFAGHVGHKMGFKKSEFGDDASNPLELAYALTVHKTQGSEFGITFLVLPRRGRILSRELLYTALTRHRQRIVILHQGPLNEFRSYTGEAFSDIAKRLTNLFDDPCPREVKVGQATRYLDNRYIHRTERGDLVMSKSEVIIADKLYDRNIKYQYEQPLVLGGYTRYPDFTFYQAASGITYYWEHLGMLTNPEYRSRWERKRKLYLEAGILPYSEGGGPNGTLIESRDQENGGLDSLEIAKIIDRVILGELH